MARYRHDGVWRLARIGIDTVVPPRCPLCGTLVDDDLQFCATCWGQLRFITDPVCTSCGRPMAQGRSDDVVCGPCLAKPPIHDGIRAAVIYDDLARQVVLKLKYGGRIGMARLIAHFLARHMADTGETRPLLVPVPLHRWRLWRRGFNQSILIARHLADDHRVEIVPDMLMRTRATPPLKGLNARDRAKIVNGAFAVNPKRHHMVKGRPILLVDDVYTSGATSNACVKALKKAGARSVTILCWARVLSEAEEGVEPVAAL